MTFTKVYKSSAECQRHFIPSDDPKKEGIAVKVRRVYLAFIGNEKKRIVFSHPRFIRVTYVKRYDAYTVAGRETKPEAGSKKGWKRIDLMTDDQVHAWLHTRGAEAERVIDKLWEADPGKKLKVTFYDVEGLSNKAPKDKPERHRPKFLGIDCELHMPQKEWKAVGKPNWWVRVGKGEQFRWITIPPLPGNKPLFVVIDLTEWKIYDRDRMIYYGVGYAGGVRGQLIADRKSKYHEVYQIPVQAKVLKQRRNHEHKVRKRR